MEERRTTLVVLTTSERPLRPTATMPRKITRRATALFAGTLVKLDDGRQYRGQGRARESDPNPPRFARELAGR